MLPPLVLVHARQGTGPGSGIGFERACSARTVVVANSYRSFEIVLLVPLIYLITTIFSSRVFGSWV